jgi:predicted AlkP superfamily pyrophosphatase or phosphodiesterase
MRRRFFPILLLLAALLAVLTPAAAQPNAAQPEGTRPYVVLVSLDGFRYDYAERYHAENLLAIGKAGAAAEGMIPSFPTVTFPNHISIVTGQYPEHHGLVGNSFWDPARQEMYSMNRASTESAFYGYKPLWVVAEEQHVKSAAMFWPTSDAEIGGVRPTYWAPYDGRFPNEQRVAKVIEWLKLPESERPHFITLYFSDVDSAGHSFGPDSPETEAAVHRVDKLVGDLWTGIKALPLPIDLIVVSDHGMQTTVGSVNLSELTDLSKVRVVTEGPVALIYAPDSQTAEHVYAALKGKNPKFEIYRRKETPAAWHFSENPRIGDLVICVKEATSLTAGPPRERPEGRGTPRPNSSRGAHGFDPAEFKTMQAIFYAAGPNVRPGAVIKPFENVNVFPFMVKILGLKSPPGIDGSEKTLDTIYRK